MISAINEVETAVQAMKHGAYHYITKDFDYDELRSLVRNACERQDLNRQVITLTAQVAEQSEREFLIGPSRQIRDIVDLVQKVAKLSATVLILGESGTGKELLARLLHRESGRGDAPFIAVNLSAIPHELVESTLFGHERGSFTGAHKQQLGKFELAAGGTLFLDEIGDLRFDLQAKLLRAIQEGEIERVGGTKPIKTDFRLVVGDQRRSREGGQGRPLPRGPLLPDQRHPDPDAAAARAHRGSAGAGAAVPRALPRRSSASRSRGIADSALKILAVVLVARQHPRAREPDRAAGRGQRQGLDHRRGSAARVPLRQARLGAAGRRSAVPGSVRHVRAQLHPARAREVRLERHRHRALPRHPAQHAQAQDGPARPARPRPQAARSLGRHRPTVSTNPANRLAGLPGRLARFWPACLATDSPFVAHRDHRVSSSFRQTAIQDRKSHAESAIGLFGQVCACLEHPLLFHIRRSGGRTCQTTLPRVAIRSVRTHVTTEERACSRRCSTFVSRSKTQNEVFLMNTFTDAQLIVSRDVAALLDRLEHRDARRLDERGARGASSTLAEHGFIVDEPRRRARRPAATSSARCARAREQLQHHGADHAAVQLRLRLLHPGGSRRLQQDTPRRCRSRRRRGVGDWVEQRLDALAPRRLVLTFFGGEPLLNMPVLYYLAERMRRVVRGARRHAC